jgi:hypothetical protein
LTSFERRKNVRDCCAPNAQKRPVLLSIGIRASHDAGRRADSPCSSLEAQQCDHAARLSVTIGKCLRPARNATVSCKRVPGPLRVNSAQDGRDSRSPAKSGVGRLSEPGSSSLSVGGRLVDAALACCLRSSRAISAEPGHHESSLDSVLLFYGTGHMISFRTLRRFKESSESRADASRLT